MPYTTYGGIKSSIEANRKSIMGSPMSHQSRSCVILNFPKMGFRIPKFDVFTEILTKKPLKVCYKVSLFRQSCSSINYLSNGVNILAGDDPVPVKFGPKGINPQPEGCAFHVSHAARCPVGISRPPCIRKTRLLRLLKLKLMLTIGEFLELNCVWIFSC